MRTLNLTHVFISAALLVAATACGNELSTDNSTSTAKATDSTFSTQTTAGPDGTKPPETTNSGADPTTTPDASTAGSQSSNAGATSTTSSEGSSASSSWNTTTTATWNTTTTWDTTTTWNTTTAPSTEPSITSFSVSGGNVCDPTTGEPIERHPVIAHWKTMNATSVYIAIQDPDGPYEQNLATSGSLELPQACPGDQIYYVVALNGTDRAMDSTTLG